MTDAKTKKLMPGSFVAVTAMNTHIVGSGMFEDSEAFHANVTAMTSYLRNMITSFRYFYGDETQEYTPREFREVYHGE